MIYKISEVSNLETALLYPYRILRTASNTLCELLRYSEPFVTQLTDYTTKSGIIEYSVDIELNPNKVPFIEFLNADLLPETADIFEVETTENKLIIRTERILSKPVDIAVYEVYSLQQIADLLSELDATLDSKSADIADTETGIGDIQIQGKWVIADNARIPDLVMIDKADDGLLYGDANCVLSGAVSSQQLVNPSQLILESMLKCLTNQLTVKIVDKHNRVFEGFYNGLLTVDSNSEILVFRNCNAVIQLNKLDCNTVIIDNCPFVFFKSDSCKVGTLEIRHSTVTIDSDTEIERVMLSRMSTVNQVRCKLGTLLLLESGSTYYVPELSDTNTIEHVEIKAIQGQFCVNDKPVYLHHQNVSFRQGQVEDPMPVTELKVDISISGGGPTPIPPTPSDPIIDPGTASERCHVLYVWLRKSGYSQNHTCGVLGNIEVESGFDPNIMEGDFSGHKWSLLDFVDYPNKGYGLIQWTFPASHSWLYNWCTAKNYDYDTLDGQIRCAAAVPMGYDLSDSVGQGGYDIFGHDGSGTATYNYSVYKNGNSTYGWAGTGDGTAEEVFSRLNALTLENAVRSWLASMERPDTSVIGDRIGRAQAILERANSEGWEQEV